MRRNVSVVKWKKDGVVPRNSVRGQKKCKHSNQNSKNKLLQSLVWTCLYKTEMSNSIQPDVQKQTSKTKSKHCSGLEIIELIAVLFTSKIEFTRQSFSHWHSIDCEATAAYNLSEHQTLTEDKSVVNFENF